MALLTPRTTLWQVWSFPRIHSLGCRACFCRPLRWIGVTLNAVSTDLERGGYSLDFGHEGGAGTFRFVGSAVCGNGTMVEVLSPTYPRAE